MAADRAQSGLGPGERTPSERNAGRIRPTHLVPAPVQRVEVDPGVAQRLALAPGRRRGSSLSRSLTPPVSGMSVIQPISLPREGPQDETRGDTAVAKRDKAERPEAAGGGRDGELGVEVG